jgi:hypothetical protein
LVIDPHGSLLQLAVTEHLSSSMNMLESAAPLPLLRELKFWQSAPVQLPGQDEDMLTVPAISTEKLGDEDTEQTQTNSAKTRAKDKRKSKKPPASGMAMLLAMQQMQLALPSIVGDGGAGNLLVKTKEAMEADRLKNLGVVQNAAVKRNATKRAAEETSRDPAKQARFAV